MKILAVLRRIAAVIVAFMAFQTGTHAQYVTGYGTAHYAQHFSAFSLLVATAFAWLAVSLWLGRRWWFAN